MEIDRGNPMSTKAQKHRLGLYLRSRNRQFLRNVAQESVITNSKQLKPKKSADSFQYEVLQFRILKYFSALNKIIHNSHIKRRISLEEQKAQKQDRFLRGRQIAYLIFEYFRVTGADDSVENYADLFTISLRNDDIQEFVSKWDGKNIVYDENPT